MSLEQLPPLQIPVFRSLLVPLWAVSSWRPSTRPGQGEAFVHKGLGSQWARLVHTAVAFLYFRPYLQ